MSIVTALTGPDLHDRAAAVAETRLPARRAAAAPVERLRVLTFLNSFAPGGVERVAARLHAAWVAGGTDARIILADGRDPPPFPVTRVSALAIGTRRRGFARASLMLLRHLPRIIAADRPHILFCAGNTYSAVGVALKLLLGRRCPLIVAKISNDLVRRDMSPVVRRAYRAWLRVQGRHIDHFIAIAPAMAGEIAGLVGVAADRITVIEDPALALADVTRLAAARDGAVRVRPGRHFLAVGRLAPQKNFALLLDAFALIAAPYDTLTILGDGTERVALEARAARLGIAAALSLPGHVNPLDRWLAQADALVMSSDYEGVPAVIVEALAAGIPIVATDCSVSMADLLGHGRLGQLVPVGDAAALAAAMVRAAGASDTGASARAAARRFTTEHASSRYTALMRDLQQARSGLPI